MNGYAQTNPSVWTTYQTEMAGVFSYLSSAVTPSGKRPDIFIATPLPLLAPQYAAADAFLENTVAPWLRDQVVYWQGEGAAVHLIDVRNDIQQQPNWQSWYSDGIHLFAPGQLGYEWLAREVLNAVLDQHRGDANLDGVVDGLDYVAWSDRFGQPGNWSQGDFNHDGVVDGLDYTAWADHFSAGSAAFPDLAIVPEPAGFGGALTGGLLLAVAALNRRRRGRHFARGR